MSWKNHKVKFMLNITKPSQSYSQSSSDSAQNKILCGSTNSELINREEKSQINLKNKVLKVDTTIRFNSHTKPLSSIETDLLNALRTGATNRIIAQERGKSAYTVRNQLSTLYAKIGVANRIQALVWLQTSERYSGVINKNNDKFLKKQKKTCVAKKLNFDLFNLHNIFGVPIALLTPICQPTTCQLLDLSVQGGVSCDDCPNAEKK
jgi:DNA-binding CsgD family transcriptional regulator